MEFNKNHKIALVIGNGKSTKNLLDYGFHNIPSTIDTFATSGAYKYCQKLNWWPTYYALTDYKVLTHKQKLFNEFLKDPTINSKKFLLCTKTGNNKALKLEDPFKKIIHCPHLESGLTCLKAIHDTKHKYDYVIVIGIDNNYSWLTNKVKRYDTTTNLAIVKERIKDHPSYFWEDYIEKGDILSWNFDQKPNTPIFNKINDNKFKHLVFSLLNMGTKVINMSHSKINVNQNVTGFSEWDYKRECINKHLYTESPDIAKYLNLIRDIE